MSEPVQLITPVVSTPEVQLRSPNFGDWQEAKRDRVREKITLLLLWLLIGEVSGVAFILMFAEMVQGTGQNFTWDHLKDLVTIILPPTITLVGTALGFYFGAKSESGASRSDTRS